MLPPQRVVQDAGLQPLAGSRTHEGRVTDPVTRPCCILDHPGRVMAIPRWLGARTASSA